MSRNVPLGMQCVFAADCIVLVVLAACARARARVQWNIVPRDINFRIWNLSRPSSPFSVPTADTLNRRFVEEPRTAPFLSFLLPAAVFPFLEGSQRKREREGDSAR